MKLRLTDDPGCPEPRGLCDSLYSTPSTTPRNLGRRTIKLRAAENRGGTRAPYSPGLKRIGIQVRGKP